MLLELRIRSQSGALDSRDVQIPEAVRDMLFGFCFFSCLISLLLLKDLVNSCM